MSTRATTIRAKEDLAEEIRAPSLGSRPASTAEPTSMSVKTWTTRWLQSHSTTPTAIRARSVGAQIAVRGGRRGGPAPERSPTCGRTRPTGRSRLHGQCRAEAHDRGVTPARGTPGRATGSRASAAGRQYDSGRSLRSPGAGPPRRPRGTGRAQGEGGLRSHHPLLERGGGTYTLNLKCMTSPSCTTYSFPSTRMSPFSFTAASLPRRSRSSTCITSALMKPRSKSVWMTPAA